MFAFKKFALVGAMAAMTLVATEAAAHARLVSATPAAGSSVAAPSTIVLTFSDKIEASSTFTVASTEGTAVAVRTQLSADGKTLTGTPATALKAGTYLVTWRISVDGHRMNGRTNFSVK